MIRTVLRGAFTGGSAALILYGLLLGAANYGYLDYAAIASVLIGWLAAWVALVKLID